MHITESKKQYKAGWGKEVRSNSQLVQVSLELLKLMTTEQFLSFRIHTLHICNQFNKEM